MHIRPIRIKIQINPNPLPEVVSIRIELDLAIALHVRTKKGVACTLVLTTDSEHAYPGLHPVFHVSAQLKKQYDGWLK